MSDLQNFEPSVEQLGKFRDVYIKVMCNAAVISGVQPSMTVSGSSMARKEILGDLKALKDLYNNGGLSSNAWAQKAYAEIENRLKPVSNFNAESVAEALKGYCQAFFDFGIQNFSVQKESKNNNPFA